MPTISMFHGIVIYLNYLFEDDNESRPHIHAKYQNNDAAFSIIDGTILTGERRWCANSK